MSTETFLLSFPFGTAEVTIVLRGTLDRPGMVLQNMVEAAQIAAEGSDGHSVSLFDQQNKVFVVHEPFKVTVNFAGVVAELVIDFSSTRYVDRRQLARRVYVLFPAMLTSLGLDIDNVQVVPTHELTQDEKLKAFLSQIVEPLAVDPHY